MQKTAVKGEVQTLEYKPGERLKESKPVEEGIYQFAFGDNRNFKGIGKGWKAKPGKYPNRLVYFKALDTEDEVSSKEKEAREIVSLSPGALRRGVMRLAQAAQYPLKLQLGPDKQPNHPTVKANAIAIDKMLNHIKENETVLRGEVSHEQYNGDTQARIKWLPPEEMDDSGSADAEAGEAEASSDDDVFGSGDEEVTDEGAELSDAEEPVAEEVSEEESTEEASEEQPEDAEIVEEDEPQAEEEFEPLPPPKKTAPGKGKVVAKKPTAKPAAPAKKAAPGKKK